MKRVYGIDADAVGPVVAGFTENRMVCATIAAETSDAFDAIEISGCIERNAFVERCAAAHADFFSVYLHYRDGGADCVGDFATIERARAYAGQIRDAFGWPVHDFTGA
ncbi:hypothetical protein WI88_32765 [Burkholderia ubonensis]|uniref:hypothetical protein n=2 Tax=Burkholderia ubonensis TaxID=101571 RepID=UPI00075C57D6|nr:hypothetical protein [Burkholderia ubonensis]KVD68733.1 hypothetical protein WI88_32765 [Burkholderia ubonensis]KWN75020.1 hypothetical protein WM23_26730 [Burkholderia ubonensis]